VIARRLSALLALVVLTATGTYVFVYLYRWEWNRALVVGLLFVATEVGAAAALVLARLRRLESALASAHPPAPYPPTPPRPEAPHAGPARRHQEATAAALRAAAPAPHRPFAWLRPPDDRLGVFVPLLMGVGIVASSLAWVVERLARATAGRALEEGLARRLSALAWPETPLASPPDDPRAALRGPVSGPPRWR